MKRNTCRVPWVHGSNLAIRQSLPLRDGHAMLLQLEVFNVLNLFHPRWGLLRTPNMTVLEHIGQVPVGASGSEPLFRFDPARPRFDSRNVESGYQFQLAMRYSF